MRIFTCELPCKNGIIFSFTFKRDNESCDLEIHLNLVNMHTNRDIKIVCKSQATHGNEISALNDESIRSVNVFLAKNSHASVPKFINNWETRYFILLFSNGTALKEHLMISDIGVKKFHHQRVLLGQMAFYEAAGIENEVENLPKIQL
jgi:hypothetical protein